jgi:hypothetical protein
MAQQKQPKRQWWKVAKGLTGTALIGVATAEQKT